MKIALASLIVSTCIVFGCDDSKPQSGGKAADTAQTSGDGHTGAGNTGAMSTSGGKAPTTNSSAGSPGGGATPTGTGGGTGGGDPTNRP